MLSKERISTRPDSKQKRKLSHKVETNAKSFHIFYNKEKLLTVEIQANKTVKDLDKLIKSKLKDRFYNFMGLESICGSEVLNYALENKEFSLKDIHSDQKFRILLEGEVHDLSSPSLNDLFFLKCLGKGGSSTVYLVRHKQNCKMYALKQVDKTYITDFRKMELILRQKKILTEIVNQSPFASKVYATFESKDHLNFLLKYYPGGEILYHLQSRKMNKNEIKLYFCQVLLAIQNLHKENILYRDLKPENILIDLKGNAILSDFGLCKVNARKQDLTTTYCGSDIYMPPEIKDQIGYSYHVDFYTLGAFLYEMLTGLPPYYNNSDSLDFLETNQIEATQLCSKLLETDMNKRLCDFNEIKHSKWLKNIDWDKLNRKKYQMPIQLNLYHSYIHEEFRQPLKFDEINEPIFDRLFDFFFYMSQDQNGISSCYVVKSQLIKQPNSKIKKEQKKIESLKDKSKEKSKSHQKNFVSKFNKLMGKQRELGKVKQKSKKKSEKSRSVKSKSYQKRSNQNSPSLHSLKEKIGTKRQKQKIQKSDEIISANIYQKSITMPQKIQMKAVKNGSVTSRLNFKSPFINTISQSPSYKKQ